MTIADVLTAFEPFVPIVVIVLAVSCALAVISLVVGLFRSTGGGD